MALKDLEIRALKPRDRIYKKADERGLYIEVHPTGSKLWRFWRNISGRCVMRKSVWGGIIRASCFGLLCGALYVPAVRAEREVSPAQCGLGPDVKLISKLEGLPTSVQADLRTRTGGLSDVDGAFNAGDSSDPSRPQHRFLGAGQRDGNIFVWYEHGGRGYHIHVLGYWVRADGNSHSASSGLQPGANFVSKPCASTIAFLRGVRSADSGDW